ncbi:hypothetical protein BLNAU_7511 [Blattamonas nauphoetae]|uniref:Uncharacterized protein n=1 Tax=Blattamonas nauphoetae TaxID=2049346 RepID=A0ABQ9Y1J3_9EUKA|nr:hypothetical protein BLNAU_7511 [Blattamonas nauphoetae]
MTEIVKKPNTSSCKAHSDLSSRPFLFSTDCSPFLDWRWYKRLETAIEKTVVFQSLVATVKLQPELDASLEEKAVELLKSVKPKDKEIADAFLGSLGQTTDHSSTDFVQSMVVLISSPSQAITTAAMEMLNFLFLFCSPKDRLALVQADLVPQLITTLNPQSLFFAEALDIHIHLMRIFKSSLWLAAPDGLEQLEIQDHYEQQAVRETVLTQVLSPSEKYIWHLCVNRFSIIDRNQSTTFLMLLTGLLEISPYYQPTMDFVLHMPVVLTIPSCLTFFKDDHSSFSFLTSMNHVQYVWNKTKGEEGQILKTIHQMLKMEGFEEVMEAKLQNDRKERYGRMIVRRSINWNNLQGTNLPEQE